MSTKSQLREKLRKIEALFAGAGTTGERLAAEAALGRGGGGGGRSRRGTASGARNLRCPTNGRAIYFSHYAGVTG